MGLNHSTPSQTLHQLHSRFRLLSQDPSTTLLHLLQRRTNQQFLLRSLTSNHQSYTSHLQHLVDQKLHNPSPYICSLYQTIFQKSANYCSYQVKAYLIFTKPLKTLRTDIIERKVRNQNYTEQELLHIIQTGTLGLRHLKQIGDEHPSINTSTIFLTKDPTHYILADPWMTPEHYQVSDHTYDSPERFQQKLSVKPQEIDWLASSLFSLGMVVLECVTMEFMDRVYEKNRGINYTLLNSFVAGIQWGSVKSYVAGLLGAEGKRLATVGQVEAWVVAQRVKYTAEFPTLEGGNGRIQLSSGVERGGEVVGAEVVQQRVVEPVESVSRGKQEHRLNQVVRNVKPSVEYKSRQNDSIQIVRQEMPKVNKTFDQPMSSKIQHKSQINVNKYSRIPLRSQVSVQSFNPNSKSMQQQQQQPQQLQQKPLTLNPKTTHPPLPSTNRILKHNSSYSLLPPSQHLTSRNSSQKPIPPSSLQKPPHHQQPHPSYPDPHLKQSVSSLNLLQTHSQFNYRNIPLHNQQPTKPSPFTLREITQSSAPKTSSLANSMMKLRSTIEKESHIQDSLQNSRRTVQASNKVNRFSESSQQQQHHHYAYVEKSEVVEELAATTAVPPRISLSPFSSSYVPKSVSSSQQVETFNNIPQVQLSKEFSFAPATSPDKLSSFGTILKSIHLQLHHHHQSQQSLSSSLPKVNTSPSDSLASKHPKIPSNQPPTQQQTHYQQRQKTLLDDLRYQIKYEEIIQNTSHRYNNSKHIKAEHDKEDNEDLSFSHINHVTKLLKQQFQDENISTIEPQRDTIKTPERNPQNLTTPLTYINPFLQAPHPRLTPHSAHLDNVHNVISFQQKRSQQPRRFNSTIIEVDDQDQSILSNTETQHVTEQYLIGSKYEGLKKSGKRNGYGVFTYKNGGHYEGMWKNNQMHGEGKLFYKSGGLAYDGEWYKDMFHGKGKVFNDPENIRGVETEMGECDWRDLGEYEDLWEYYQGDLRKDQKDGFGILKFANGEVFEGEFKEDKIDGKGRFTRRNGEIVVGVWRAARLERLSSS